ncbi:MipA/OmpV family protein [Roseateles aquatilis]|uniref:MipA/OmpV family protein n=1 Tax=Roseateles aquatilis TaxID=431061 RepID=UPI0013034B88|nr:MipA/OmpV family protein [Roseateles aquatilis]
MLPFTRTVLGTLSTAVVLYMASCVMCADDSRAAGSLLLMDAPPATASWSGGLTARNWPSAPGGREQSNGLLPAFEYLSPNGAFVSTDLGVGWNVVPLLASPQTAKDWQIGARLWPQFGRPKRLTPNGVDRLGSRVTTEAFANVQALPYLLLQSGVSWGSGRHHDGAQLEIGATSGIPIGDDVIGISVAATAANAAHLGSSYGIGPGESRASGLPVWRPRAGWMDWSIGVSGEHKFNERWSVSGQWLTARLIGDAAHSPLTKSATQQSITLSVWRRF